MNKFTEQDLIEIEIEKQSLLTTANIMSAGDACMEIRRAQMVENLRTKAQHIQEFQDYLRQDPFYAATMQKIADMLKNSKINQ